MIDRLRELTAEGYSASKIGSVLGVTRNAIIGKCHRDGIVLRGRERVKLPAPQPKPKSCKPEPKISPLPIAACAPIRMVDRADSQCPFPVWEHKAKSGFPDFLVCGAELGLTENGGVASYCQAHMAITHTGSRPKRNSKVFPHRKTGVVYDLAG